MILTEEERKYKGWSDPDTGRPEQHQQIRRNQEVKYHKNLKI